MYTRRAFQCVTVCSHMVMLHVPTRCASTLQRCSAPSHRPPSTLTARPSIATTPPSSTTRVTMDTPWTQAAVMMMRMTSQAAPTTGCGRLTATQSAASCVSRMRRGAPAVSTVSVSVSSATCSVSLSASPMFELKLHVCAIPRCLHVHSHLVKWYLKYMYYVCHFELWKIT